MNILITIPCWNYFKFGTESLIEMQSIDHAAAHLQILLPENPSWLGPQGPVGAVLAFGRFLSFLFSFLLNLLG